MATTKACRKTGPALTITGLALVTALGCALVGPAPSASPAHGEQGTPPATRNVILLIGDGMGDSEITIARNYWVGAAGRLPGIDALPVTGSYTTYSLHRETGKVDYVPDSAATASAWATGVKTYDGAISVDLKGQARTTILEKAKEAGLRTGNVSTATVYDATPAALVAHVGDRGCAGPQSTSCANPGAPQGSDLLERGGHGSISEQLLATAPDLTLGGGASTFAQRAKAGAYSGKTLWAQADARGYRTVRRAKDLAAVTSLDKPLLGLFADGHFPTRFNEAIASKNGGAEAAVRCTNRAGWLGAGNSGLSLQGLTEKAISLLDDPERGFFLQVEGASIDKRDHAADACGQIGETIDLDEAVQSALDFAKRDGNTLVIVTADHAHTSQIVENGTSAGYTITLKTADDSEMTVSYATVDEGATPTGGPGAGGVAGVIDQTDLHSLITRALTDQSGPVATTPTKVTPLVTIKTAKKVKTGTKPKVKVIVKAEGVAAVTGKVKVRWGKGAKRTKTVALKARGKVTIRLPKLNTGTHRVTATYLGTDTVAKRAAQPVRIRVR